MSWSPMSTTRRSTTPTAHHLFRVLRVARRRDGHGHRRSRSVAAVPCGRGEALEPTGASTRRRRTRAAVHGRLRDPQGRSPGVDRAEADRDRHRPDRAAPRRAIGRALGGRSGRTGTSTSSQRVAVEALQQSRGVWLPEIVGPVPAARCCTAVAGGRAGRAAAGRRRPTAWRSGRRADGPTASSSWPSTGIDSAPTVLRVETAAVAGSGSAGDRRAADRHAVVRVRGRLPTQRSRLD